MPGRPCPLPGTPPDPMILCEKKACRRSGPVPALVVWTSSTVSLSSCPAIDRRFRRWTVGEQVAPARRGVGLGRPVAYESNT